MDSQGPPVSSSIVFRDPFGRYADPIRSTIRGTIAK